MLAKVYANDKCARRLFSQSPDGPSVGSVWRKVSRPQPPEFVKGIVHYELAVENDIQRILDFWETKLDGQNPLMASIGEQPSRLIVFSLVGHIPSN